jgi:hypothetical protein
MEIKWNFNISFTISMTLTVLKWLGLVDLSWSAVWSFFLLAIPLAFLLTLLRYKGDNSNITINL